MAVSISSTAAISGEAPTARVAVEHPTHALVLPDGAVVEVRHLVTVVGRATDATVELADASVSRRHAEIRLVGGRAVLRDLGSTNGTTVNERPVSEHVLADGDRVVFGSVPVTVRVS